MDPDERPDSQMNPATVTQDSDDESDTSEVAPSEDQIQQALDLLAKDPSGENLTAFQQLGKARLPTNLQMKTLGGPLFFTDIYKSNGWRVQQHKVTGLCRVLDTTNVRVAWGSKGALGKTFAALLQLKGLATVTDTAKAQPIDLVMIPEEDLPKFQERVADMERGIRHPLGADTFETHHGADYFAFFRRMGKVFCFVGLHEGRVVALANGALRQLRYRADKPARPVWRLGDLKVRPEYRGQGLTLRMLRAFVPDLYGQGSRAYLVTMNPADHPATPNPVVHIMGKIPFRPFRQGPNLLFYSLSKAEMAVALEPLRRHRGGGGDVSFLSLQGVKDIVLTSTGRPLPLLHAQFGPCAQRGQFAEPQEGHTHMFCVPEGDPLAAELAQFPVAATASTMHHGLGRTNWQWVLTSEV